MGEVLRQARNHLRPLYWRVRFTLLNSPWARRYAIGRRLIHPQEGMACSVCGSADVWLIRFFIEHRVDKCYCRGCQHIFSRHLNRDVQKASTLFAYDQPNAQYEGQKRLQIELVRATGAPRGQFLDFGVGGNIGIAGELRELYPQHDFHSADLYPSRHPGYFQLYSPAALVHRFDGISSNAVIEHLDNTLEAWRYLNRLLKPMAEGGGLMIHAFPSQIVEDPNHWTIKIASHECVFSGESLALTCRQAGFQLLRWKYFADVQHPVYYFRKERDVE